MMNDEETRKRIKDFSVYPPDFEVSSEDDLVMGFWEFGDGAFRIKKDIDGYDPDTRDVIGKKQLAYVRHLISLPDMDEEEN